MPSKSRFSIYDMLEEKKVFASNPANADARGPHGEVLYKGPQEFPRMFYHPLGEMEITRVGEGEMVMGQPRVSGEEKQMVCRLAETPAQARELRHDGWHDHPAKAVAAAIAEGIAHPYAGRHGSAPRAPAMGSEQRISDLERQIAELTREREESLAALAPKPEDPKAKPFKASTGAKASLDLSALGGGGGDAPGSFKSP